MESETFKIDYKLLTIHRNPLFTRLKIANEEVKRFIKERGLIITGGTAIDWLLRLKGDHIYNLQSADTALPDYDFYSSNHVKDAYDLADILLKMRVAEHEGDINYYRLDCIRGLHIQTLRVRLMYEALADITYIDPRIIDKIPFLIIDGIKVVHPHWQMMAQHHALAFPMEDPPKEVLFNRLNKDITRHAKLYAAYPFPEIAMGTDMYKVKWDFSWTKNDVVLQGFSAYAAFFSIYARFGLAMENIHPAEINSTGFTSPIDVCEFISAIIDENVQWRAYYEPFMDNSLPIYELKGADSLVVVHHLDNTVIPVSRFTLEKSKESKMVLVPESNIVLLCFLLGYHTSEQKSIYGKFYNSLMLMVQRMSAHVVQLLNEGKTQKAREIVYSTPFFIPRKLYGAVNESNSFVYQKLRMIRELQRYAKVEPTSYNSA
jgi:hypothetical protein